MKQLMVDNNTAASHSFLLDDDSSIPFSLDDISNLMEDKVRCCREHQHVKCKFGSTTVSAQMRVYIHVWLLRCLFVSAN